VIKAGFARFGFDVHDAEAEPFGMTRKRSRR
jgi:hypothetical protein